MDSILFKKNLHFDSLIDKLVSNEISCDNLIESLCKNSSNLNYHEENFIFYFLNCLHYSFDWIIYDSNINTIIKKKPNTDLKKDDQVNNLSENSIIEELGLSKNKIQNSINDKNLNLGSKEEFPDLNENVNYVKKKSKKKKNSKIFLNLDFANSSNDYTKKMRRIKPTKIDSLDFSKNKIFEKSPIIDFNVKEPRKEIEIMTKKINSLTFDECLIDSKSLAVSNKSDLNFILASNDKVSIDKEKFENFINFFFKLIKFNIVSNFLNEINYLLKVISKKVTVDSIKKKKVLIKFFSNYHNCVYFSVNVLELLYKNNYLLGFDISFLKDLSCNENIKNFSPDFQKKLLIDSENLDEFNDSSSSIPGFDFVAFEPEKDSKQNFLDEKSFYLFSKQRDSFFNLYYEWKNLNAKKGFKNESIANNLEFKFSKKVSFILSLSNDSFNYFNLAQLFFRQMMQCCIGTNETNLEKNDNQNKLFKLNKRFVIQEQKAMATQSSFFGEELFFYEFILVSNNYCFLTILKDLILVKINELNNPNLLIEAIELNEQINKIVSYFCANLLNLQLLAKFLGVIVFLPFNNIKSSILVFNNSFQSMCTDEINLSKVIIDNIKLAIKNKHLILTLPWVIQFLNQIGLNTSLFLNYNESIQLLIDIYHNLGLNKDKYQINDINYIYLTLLFGNFFDKYPSIIYQKLFKLPLNNSQVLCFNDFELSLDNHIFVTKKFIRESFPKFFTMKQIIKEVFQQNLETRKIKPILINCLNMNSIQNSFNQNDYDLNNLRLELEENFFRLHPVSLRKSVDFVADRIYFKCIKKIQHDMIEKIKNDIFKKHKDLSLTKTILEEILKECYNFIKIFSESEISKTLDALLSEYEFNQNVKQFAISISSRQCLEKCHNWVSNNINDDWIINKSFSQTMNTEDIIIEKKINNFSKKDLINVTTEFNKLRLLISNLIFEQNSDLNKNELFNLVDEIVFIRSQNKLSEPTCQSLDVAFFDLIILLIANKPKICDHDLLNKFISYYKTSEIIIKKFFSPRNTYILSLSQEPYHTWNKFESCLIKLIENKIYKVDSIESDILSILGKKQEWSETIFQKLASCIRSATDVLKKSPQSDAQQIELVDWLSWFCRQANDY